MFLFKINNSKGVIFYLHGNGNSLEKFGKLAPIYTNLEYDIFMTDYRGYGKSEGALSDENQLFEDNQFLYNELKKSYKEENIIKISFRSQGNFDVNQFARDHFSGGGHINAAGGKSDLSLQETINKFEELITQNIDLNETN